MGRVPARKREGGALFRSKSKQLSLIPARTLPVYFHRFWKIKEGQCPPTAKNDLIDLNIVPYN
jgi:hypothetical protein